jgi:DHA1 family multidrug resistance protein-like MFS transporter
MGSFMPLYIETDLNYSLIEATYWTGIAQLVSSSLFALTAPFWGHMCDRVGIKKITMIIIAANSIVYAGMALSSNIPQILLFRALQGSFGGISTAMFSLVALTASEKDLKKAMSYQMAMMTAGSLFGPGIGGLIASMVGYRFTFVASSLFFIAVIPLVYLINVPPPKKQTEETASFGLSELRSIIPDLVSLVLVYACIGFIVPVIPWFLRFYGIPNEQLLAYTTATTMLNGLAFIIAGPLLTGIVSNRTLPILSGVAAAAILCTGFVGDVYQFIALRVSIGAIQAGIPPSLLGGRSRRGTVMGFLNSARFFGNAIGPFVATSILGNGEGSAPMNMYVTMTIFSAIASVVMYLSHRKTAGER